MLLAIKSAWSKSLVSLTAALSRHHRAWLIRQYAATTNRRTSELVRPNVKPTKEFGQSAERQIQATRSDGPQKVGKTSP
ncbi:MAG: hypothetical protein D4R77_01870 [Planctomycetaceae bacterium]|nr:MAG: hypothetical protein D4R77_01870 [Planctomycetaceae bacterium]